MVKPQFAEWDCQRIDNAAIVRRAAKKVGKVQRGEGSKIKKSTIQNVDYFHMREGVRIFKLYPNSND